jgi:predicted ATP-grasp superfamily ATP-dependent carboligase
MPTPLPRSSPADGASILIAAVSGRALAAAARRAGLIPLVADFFADADTGRLAPRCLKLYGCLKDGMRWSNLEPALDALAAKAPSPVLGFLNGSGFEDRTELLARAATRWTLLGNDASVVAKVKAPESFFAELARLGIAHPMTVSERPQATEGWLVKRRGGAGGSHVVLAGRRMSPKGSGPVYFQKKVDGRPISALFIGNGREARVLGFSEQWAAPTATSKWRYGGAFCPADLPAETQRRMTESTERVAAAFQLTGLGSADFLVGDREAWLLEVNPRPGATLDIFDSEDKPLLGLHLDAVRSGRLPDGPLKLDGARAAAIVYAPEAVQVSPEMSWPDWAADQPKSGEWIDKNRPICTVWARSKTKVEARRLIEERIARILDACGGKQRETSGAR